MARVVRQIFPRTRHRTEIAEGEVYEKILIAEDNTELNDMMRNYLIKAGHSVYQAFNGAQALEYARSMQPDLVLLDIMMPVVDGYEVCKSLRREYSIPVIVVSAIVGEDEKLRMFELGADDYMTKPFSFKEMVGRVNAQLRRYYEFNTQEKSERVYGKMKISSTRHEVKVDGESVPLTLKEFNLLDFLTKNANQIFSKQKLIDVVWGYDDYIDENTVAVTVARLREKLAKFGIENVVTVWGLGYKWQD